MTSTLPITDDELPALFAGLERVPLALAVSGGADSMALMHMIARWAAREDVRAAYDAWWRTNSSRLRPGFSGLPARPAIEEKPLIDSLPHVMVLTVDHGLRAEAGDEAAFVAREAAKLGLTCQVLRWEGDKPATGVQAAAREARRSLLVEAVHAELAQLSARLREHGIRWKRGARTLVMAHHLEDQAETLLMRLARGSGLDGLRGMRARDEVMRQPTTADPVQLKAPLARPLLGVAKARLVTTLQVCGASWIEDPSNDDERFERVRVRKALRQLEPLGFTAEKLALSARRLADAEEPLRSFVEEVLKPAHIENHHWLYGEVEVGGPLFAGMYFGVRTLRQLLLTYGGAARAPELAQMEALFHLACSPDQRTAHKRLTLGGCIVEFRGGRYRAVVRVYREGRGERLPVVRIAPGQRVDWDGKRFTVLAHRSATSTAQIRALGMQGWADLKRAVKGLDDLGWPAAAMATVPVIECGGVIVAYPVIDRAMRWLPSGKYQAKERWDASAFVNRSYDAIQSPRQW